MLQSQAAGQGTIDRPEPVLRSAACVTLQNRRISLVGFDNPKEFLELPGLRYGHRQFPDFEAAAVR
jgi:hypothetical protein